MTRLSVSTWDNVNPQVSDTGKPWRNIRSSKHRSRAALRLPFGGLQELLDFSGNEVFTVVHHFVQCLECQNLLNASNGAGSVF
jgi:hypothetical protein